MPYYKVTAIIEADSHNHAMKTVWEGAAVSAAWPEGETDVIGGVGSREIKPTDTFDQVEILANDPRGFWARSTEGYGYSIGITPNGEAYLVSAPLDSRTNEPPTDEAFIWGEPAYGQIEYEDELACRLIEKQLIAAWNTANRPTTWAQKDDEANA